MRSVPILSIFFALSLVSCSGSDGGGSGPTNVALDEGNVTTMEEGLTYELVPDGGASAGSSVQSWRWSALPIVEGALSQCSAVEQFDLEQAATGLEAACTVPGKCTLSFDQVSTTSVQGSGQSRFSVRIPILKADVGVTYRLEAIDTNGQSSVGNFTFCLLAINEQPSAQDDAFTVTEGAPLVVSGDSGINLLTNDTDDVYVGNLPLAVSSTPVRAPTIATSFSLQPDGGFSYFYEGDAVVAGGTQIRDSFQYEVTDGTFTTVATVNLTIVAVDNPPQLTGDLPDLTVIAGVPVEVDFADFFTDPEAGDLFFSAIGLPASGELQLTPLGVLTGMATPADAGSYQVQIQADDQQSSAVGLFNLVVQGNLPPEIVPIPDQTITYGDLVSLDTSEYFNDPEDIALTYSLQSQPQNDLQINPETGLITGLITIPGVYELTVSVDDAAGNIVSIAFTLTQQAAPNRAPVFTGQISDQSVTVNASINPVSGEFSDPDDDPLTYSIDNTVAGLSFNSNTGVLSGQPSVLGISTFVITAEDPEGLSVLSNRFRITVTEVPNSAPVFTGSIGAQSGRVGEPISAISGDFSDPDGDTLTFASTTLPAGLTLSPAGVITGTPTSPGSFTVTITATDSKGASVSSNAFSIVIEPPVNNPPDITGVQPSAITVQAGEDAGLQINVSDEDNSSLVYSAVSGNTSVATISGGANGAFTVNGIAQGSTTVTVTVTDDETQSTTQSINVTVTPLPNDPPSITARNPAGNLALDQGEVQAVVLTVTDENPSTLAYSGTTNNASVATVTTNANNSFNVTGITEGQATITLTVEDAEGLSDAVSFAVNVAAPANGAPEITATSPSGSLTLDPAQTQVVTITVSDENPATLVYSSSSSSAAVVTVSTNANNSFTVTGVAEGQATVTLQVTDDENLSDSVSIAVTVAAPPDAPPVITSRTPAGSITLDEAQAQVISVSVTDENPATLEYSGSVSNPAVATIAVNANDTYTLTAVAPGQATVTLTVTDAGDQSDTDSFTVTVSEPLNGAPEINSRTPSGSIALEPGDTSSVSLDVSDEDVASLVYLASSSDSDIATVVVNANDSFTISAIADGTAQITLTIRDSGGLEDSVVVPVVVDAGNQPPVIDSRDPAGSASLAPGEDVEVTLSVSDESPATLAFDASSSNPGVATVSGGNNGIYTVSAVADGAATITFTVSDDEGLEDTASMTVDVSTDNLAPVITGRDPATDLTMIDGTNDTVTLTVDDESIATLVYTAASDATDVASVVAGVGGVYNITAEGPGSAILTLTVTDADGLFDTDTLTVTVSAVNEAPEIVSRLPAGVIGLAPADAVNVSITVTDENPATLVYTADSDDTDVVASAVSLGDGDFLITAGAAASGSATVTLTVTDAGELFATESVEIEIDSPPTIDSRAPATDLLLQTNDSETVTLTVSDESVASLQYAGQSSQPGIVAVSNVDNIYTLDALLAGQSTITFTITDENGQSDTDTLQVTVDDPPVIVSRAPSGVLDIPEGTSTLVSLVLSDEDLASVELQASSGDSLIASVSVTGDDEIEILGQSIGSTVVSITVTDEFDQSDSVTIPVDVTAAALAGAQIASSTLGDTMNGDNMITVNSSTAAVLSADN